MSLEDIALRCSFTDLHLVSVRLTSHEEPADQKEDLKKEEATLQ